MHFIFSSDFSFYPQIAQSLPNKTNWHVSKALLVGFISHYSSGLRDPAYGPALSARACLSTSVASPTALQSQLLQSLSLSPLFASLLRLQKPCFPRGGEWQYFLNAYPPENLSADLLCCLFVLVHRCIKSNCDPE